MITKKLPVILLVIYLILFIVCAINPYNRPIWLNENTPVVIVVLLLIITYKKFRFSNTSYVIMFVAMIRQTIGGYYTFERVPFAWFDNLFGFSRNMYDRVGHFLLGLYAYPVAEYLLRKKLERRRWLVYVIPIIAVFAAASMYEILERVYPLFAGSQNAAAFLGSQGDLWDSQKDMLCNGIGSIAAITFFRLQKKFYS